jgi:hypothetical protein|tara:strand:+ start:513 stop:896 length:384 start_codon:yes stop_codon:yes gene_type:complete
MNGRGDGRKLKIWGEIYHKYRTDSGKIYIQEEGQPMAKNRGDHAPTFGAVRVKGDIPDNGVINFPADWKGKIDIDSIVIMVTPHGAFQRLYVDSIQGEVSAVVANAISGPIKGSYMIICNLKGYPKN